MNLCLSSHVWLEATLLECLSVFSHLTEDEVMYVESPAGKDGCSRHAPHPPSPPPPPAAPRCCSGHKGKKLTSTSIAEPSD